MVATTRVRTRTDSARPGTPEGPSGAAVGGPLDTYANNSSPGAPKPGTDQREHRYARRAVLHVMSSLPRCRRCGRVAVVKDSGPTLRYRDGVAGWAGLATCGSVWVCPVCNAKIMGRRALEWGSMIAAWQAEENSVGFMTFTMRHTRTDRLSESWDAVAGAWSKVTSGKGWLLDKSAHAVRHVLRVVEVTYGPNGWHVHLHVLVFVEGRPGLAGLVRLHGSMFGRWRSALKRSGFRAPTMAGQDVREAGTEWVADYLAKTTDRARAVGRELAWSQGKTARSVFGTRTPWTFLDGIAAGDADELDRWHAWEKGSAGRRQVTYTKGMRDYFRLSTEQTDEQIAAEQMGTAEDDVVTITAAGWLRLLTVDGTSLGPLQAMERGGWSAVKSYLDARAVGYRRADGREVAA